MIHRVPAYRIGVCLSSMVLLSAGCGDSTGLPGPSTVASNSHDLTGDDSSGSAEATTTTADPTTTTADPTTTATTATASTTDKPDPTTTTTDPTATTGSGPTTDPTGEPRPNDADGDGVTDDADNCPGDPNPKQEDTDKDNDGDACDDDDDDDGYPDAEDNCPLINAPPYDLDKDGDGDACDDDDDGDGVLDDDDNCSELANPDQANADGDSQGDACDDNDDNDLLDDELDNCPLVSNTKQQDLDGDGVGDACDPDGDGDSVLDEIDPDDEIADCPGKMIPNTVYAATWDTIYAFNVETKMLTKLATTSPGEAGYYDLAIDKLGHMYSLHADGGSGAWLTCVSLTTGKVYYLISTGYVPPQQAGLAAFPPGIFDPDGKQFAILGWDRILRSYLQDFKYIVEFLAKFAIGHHTGGDLTYVAGLGTYAAVRIDPKPQVVVIVKFDPVAGTVLEPVVSLDGYSPDFGLATWGKKLFAFGLNGEILEIDPVAKSVNLITDTNLSFRGAAGPL